MVIMASDVSVDEGATRPEEMNRYGHVATQCTAAMCSTITTPSSLLCINLKPTFS